MHVFLSFWTINWSVFRHVFIKSTHASNFFQCRHFKILVGVKKNNKKPCLGISVTEYLTISILKKSLIGSLECSDRVVFQKHFLNYPSFFPFNLNTLKNFFNLALTTRRPGREFSTSKIHLNFFIFHISKINLSLSTLSSEVASFELLKS